MRARLLLAASVLAAFGASLSSGFHFDDYAIFGDARLTPASAWSAIFSAQQTRPLTYLTFWLNRALGGQDAFGYHALNLALHLAAALLAYECLLRLLETRAAWLAAALFAVHPLQTEAVDYIWGRAIVLAAVFVLASLLAWINGHPWLSVVLFGLALLAKEECAAFPLALWLLDFAMAKASGPTANGGRPGEHSAGTGKRSRDGSRLSRLDSRRHGGRRRPAPWGPLATMFALSLAAGLRTIYAAAVTPGTQAGAQAGITPWDYFLAEGSVVWRYLRLFLIPYGFTVDAEIRVPHAWLGIGAWLLLIGGLAAVWRWRSDLAVWLTAAMIMLMPSSSILPAADLAADRRMYLALLPLAAGAALLLARLRPRAIAPLAIAALMAMSIGRTQVWASDTSLWREAVRRAPDKVRPRIQLARSVGTEEALAVLAEARRIAPDDPAVAAETGRVLMIAGRPGEALAEFGRALALAPRDANNYNNRGVALEALGQAAAARDDFLRALELNPALAPARENLRKLAQ